MPEKIVDRAGLAISFAPASAVVLATLAFYEALIVRPGSELFSWEALFPLSAAVGLALYQLTTRAVSQADDPRVTMFFSSAVAFRYAQAALVASVGYSAIVAAVVIGWLMFDHIPDGWSLLGMAVIAFSGVLQVKNGGRA